MLPFAGSLHKTAAAAATNAPVIRPERRITLDTECSGAWVVTGDLDGDGRVEIVSALNADQNDVHFTGEVTLKCRL